MKIILLLMSKWLLLRLHGQVIREYTVGTTFCDRLNLGFQAKLRF